MLTDFTASTALVKLKPRRHGSKPKSLLVYRRADEAKGRNETLRFCDHFTDTHRIF